MSASSQQSVSSPTGETSRDYFAMFQLTPTFDLDLEDLGERFRTLQRHFHPDRHVSGGATQARMAAQMSADLNAAYQTLKAPVPRAGYLLERQGCDLEALGRQPVAGDFLLEQMELREAVYELPEGASDARSSIHARAEALFNAEITSFREGLESGDLALAGTAWVHMLYLDKLRSEIALDSQLS